MAGFKRIKNFVDTEDSGAVRYYTWRKSPTQITTIGVWFDLSMSPGNPQPKYWFDAAPLNAVQVKQSTDGGIFHGSGVSPSNKFLRKTTLISTAATALPMPMILCDYLMYYPSIDEGTTDTQILTNGVSLPRYETGEGVQVIAVSVAARTGGKSFYFNYTNSDGVSGRTSGIITQNSTSVIGSLVNTERTLASSTSPFLPLQSGDKGVRYIESVTMLEIDVGLFSLILVKPLVTTQIRGIDAPVEVDYFVDNPSTPQIYDNAFLNYLCFPQGTLASTALHGDLKVIIN